MGYLEPTMMGWPKPHWLLLDSPHIRETQGQSGPTVGHQAWGHQPATTAPRECQGWTSLRLVTVSFGLCPSL